jgi:hypothetical protein
MEVNLGAKMGPISNLGDLAGNGPADASSSTRKASVPVVEDQAQLSTVPLEAQVEQIQRTHPSSFEAVLHDAVRGLRAAAAETPDPVQAAYLSGLANRFQRLEETGVPDVSSNPNPST